MQKHSFTYRQSHQFSSFILNYFEGNEAFKNYQNLAPKIENFENAIRQISHFETDRDLLIDELIRQNGKEGKKYQNILKLKSPKTFTITTGHQLCLATGPLYFIYKILSVIKLCEQLKQIHPEYEFVPVYWMASEDNDFEEINHIHLFNKKIVWNGQQSGAVGRFKPDTALEESITELKTILGNSELAIQLGQQLELFYLQSDNLSAASRKLVDFLFQEYGLITIEPDAKAFKNAFKKYIKEDIFNQLNYQKVEESIAELTQNELLKSVQVKPREINFFYLKNDLRERIVFEENVYKVLNTDLTFSKAELENEIELNPENFSPNVVTRPLFQQFLMPNLAYIGGPGELAYWLEYKKMFEANHLFFPILVPRNFIYLMDKNTQEKWQKLGFELEHIFENVEELKKEYVFKNSEEDFHLNDEKEEISKIYKTAELKISKIDASLVNTLQAELQKTLNSFQNLESKLVKAQKKKFEGSLESIDKIIQKLKPNGTPQERFDNFLPYYLKNGENFINEIYQKIEVINDQVLILTENQ